MAKLASFLIYSTKHLYSIESLTHSKLGRITFNQPQSVGQMLLKGQYYVNIGE